MAQSVLSVSALLNNSKNTLQVATQLLMKADRNVLLLHQTSQQLSIDFDNVRSQFEKTLADFSMVIEQPLLGDVSQIFDQFSNLFEAYGLLRGAFRILRSTATDPHYISNLNGRFNYLLIDSMQNKLAASLNWLVMQLGMNGNPQTPPMKTVLDIFHKCVDHIKNGPLENWRREQKRSMLGIKVKPNELTEAVQLLQIAQKGFKSLMRIWQQLYQLTSYSTDLAMRNRAFNDCKVLLKHLLQSSFIIEWSMCGCGERKTHKGQTGNSAFCRTKFQPPTVVARGAAVDEDKVTVIPKLLAVSEEVCQNFSARFNLRFVRPADNEITVLKEEEALKLRNGDKSGLDAIGRGGKINGVYELQNEEGKVLGDGSLGFSFTNLALNFDGDKRAAPYEYSESQPSPAGKNRLDRRRAETKYHMQVTANVNFQGSDENIELKTISTPFMISVNAPQFSQVYRAMFWSILASAPESVTFADDDNATVIWGDMSEAIKWMFYTLTVSRELRDAEVDHIGYQIFKLNNSTYKGAEFKPSPFMMLTRGDIQSNSVRNGDSNSVARDEAQFSFWDWFFNAVEMVDDRNSKILPTKMATTDPEKKDWRTMAGLFRSGVIFGFIGRDEATRILRSLPYNAALLRISDHFCSGLTVACCRKIEGSPEGVFELVPLNSQMLSSGLPQLLAKLTQLDGIEAIASYHPHHGLISVAKRDLIGPLGPNIRMNSNVEYEYSNPVIGVVANGVTNANVDQNRNVQHKKAPISDDQLRNLAASLGPDNGAKLALLLQDLFLRSNNSSTSTTPAPFSPPDASYFQPSPQNFQYQPPCQFQQPQQSYHHSVNNGSGPSYQSPENFETYQQPAGLQMVQNGAVSSSSNVFNGVHHALDHQSANQMVYTQHQYFPPQNEYQTRL